MDVHSGIREVSYIFSPWLEHLRPVLRSWINLSRISLRYLGWLNQIFAVQDKRYYEAGYQLGKSTQGFPIWISARSHKGEVLTASDQSQTWRNSAEQTTLPWRSRQLFFNNMKNSITSSRPKATLLLQQKPGRNTGRQLLIREIIQY